MTSLFFLFQYKEGDATSQAAVERMMPKKVKKRRRVETEDQVVILVSPYTRYCYK